MRARVGAPGASPVTVRPARLAEHRSLESLQRRASLQNPDDRDILLANLDAIELPLRQISDGRVLVAEREGKVMGFAAILPRADGDAELDGLFVEPDCWRQGVGRALVEHSANAARSTGARHLYVLGNPHAERFYIACGFEVLGHERTRFGTGLRMKMACA